MPPSCEGEPDEVAKPRSKSEIEVQAVCSAASSLRTNQSSTGPPPARKTPPGCRQSSISRPASRSTIGDIAVSPFTIPHDAADPVGFVFKAEGVRMAFATDLGYIPPNVKAQLKGVDLLLLESNHDLEMLRDGPYPWAVKQRVLSTRRSPLK